MINKVLSSLAIIGVLGIISYEYMQATYLQERFASFVNKGPRYTAQDGAVERQERKQTDQELCERLAKLERMVAGVFPSYNIQSPCAYHEVEAVKK